MPKALTIRNLPDEVGKRLHRLSRDGGKSLNAVVVGILTDAVGVDARRIRLERYATWTPEDAAAFDDAVASQRVIDADLWR
jgi:plasmid stability protein